MTRGQHAVVTRMVDRQTSFGIAPAQLSKHFLDLMVNLRQKGYQACAMLIDCKGFGIAPHRLRSYIVCTRRHPPTQYLAELSAQTILESTSLRMRKLEEFLLDGNSEGSA